MSQKKRRSWSFWGCSILLISALLMIVQARLGPPQTVANAQDAEKAQRLVLPKSANDERTEFIKGDYIAGNGVLEPADREIRIAAATNGRIAEILVKEGEQVEAGSVLLRMDDEVEAASLQVAEAELDIAKAELQRTMRGLRQEEVDAAIAVSLEARAKADLAQSNVKRTEELFQSGATTKQELDSVKRQAEANLAALEAAEARKRAAMAGGRAEDILVARAKVKAAEARILQVKAELDQKRIKAPRAGKILQIKTRPGELYSLNNPEPLVLLGDTTTLRARIDIDERDIAKIRLHAPSFITLPAFPGRKIEGRVLEIGQRMGRKNVRTDDPTERIDTKILEVVLELKDIEGLLPGLRVIGYLEVAPLNPVASK